MHNAGRSNPSAAESLGVILRAVEAARRAGPGLETWQQIAQVFAGAPSVAFAAVVAVDDPGPVHLRAWASTASVAPEEAIPPAVAASACRALDEQKTVRSTPRRSPHALVVVPIP